MKKPTDKELKIYQDATNITIEQILSNNDLFIGDNNFYNLIKLYTVFLENPISITADTGGKINFIRQIENKKIEELLKDIEAYLIYMQEKLLISKGKNLLSDIDVYFKFKIFLNERKTISDKDYLITTISLIENFSSFPLPDPLRHNIEIIKNKKHDEYSHTVHIKSLDFKKESVFAFSNISENEIIIWFKKLSDINLFENSFDNYIPFRNIFKKKTNPHKIIWKSNLKYLIKLSFEIIKAAYNENSDIVRIIDSSSNTAEKKINTDLRKLVTQIIHDYFLSEKEGSYDDVRIRKTIYDLKNRTKQNDPTIDIINQIFDSF